MFGFAPEKYNFYLDEYNKFIKDNNEFYYTSLAKEVFSESEICQILRYPSTVKGSQKVFLIVTSIFNSPEIFFVNQDNNWLANLQKLGDVYLANWTESKKQMRLENYAAELSDSIVLLQKQTSKKVHLIGHCIGGVIALGSASLNPEKIESLSLLTTPWDYSHFYNPIMWQKSLCLDLAIQNYEFIPKVYLQILFFMLFPDQFCQKMSKYFSLKNKEDKEKYMKVEGWLQSGQNLSRSMYNEIINDLGQQNMLIKNNWSINGKVIDLRDVSFPVCIIAAKRDKIAPLSSMQSLQNSIKNITLIEVDGGHISYLINNDNRFQKEYMEWLQVA